MTDTLDQKLLDFDLICSVKEGNYIRARWLLSIGADPHTCCGKGRTCISHAIQLREPNGGTSQLGVALVNLLESHGANAKDTHRSPEEL